VNGATFVRCDLSKIVAVALVIAGGEEAALSIVAPLHDVLSNTREIEARFPSHDDVPRTRRAACREGRCPSVGDFRVDVKESAL